MNCHDLEFPGFFTKTGKDIWKLEYFCMSPTAKLKNLETGQTEEFGMEGLTAQSFHKIKMPVEVEKESQEKQNQ